MVNAKTGLVCGRNFFGVVFKLCDDHTYTSVCFLFHFAYFNCMHFRATPLLSKQFELWIR